MGRGGGGNAVLPQKDVLLSRWCNKAMYIAEYFVGVSMERHNCLKDTNCCLYILLRLTIILRGNQFKLLKHDPSPKKIHPVQLFNDGKWTPLLFNPGQFCPYTVHRLNNILFWKHIIIMFSLHNIKSRLNDIKMIS